MMRLVTPLLVQLAAACTAPAPRAGPPGTAADALLHRSRAETSTFWESTDAAAKGTIAYVCTGVASLTLHDAADPDQLTQIGQVTFPRSNTRFPRCSHVDVLGDRMAVTARNDEVQPEAFIALLDVSRPADPDGLDDVSLGDELVEEAVLVGDQVFLAATTGGVLVYDISGDTFDLQGRVEGLGTVTRAGRAPGGGAAVGNVSGQVHIIDPDRTVRATIEMGAPVTALEPLPDGRLLVALGSRGLAVVDVDTQTVTAQVPTHGTALRLWPLDDEHVLLANWSDLRVYDVSGDAPVLQAVDAVFESEEEPRTFAVAGVGDRVYAATWTGVHALTWDPRAQSPEITPSTLEIGVAANGEPQEAQLTVLNEGQQRLVVDRVQTENPWSADVSAFELAPGEEQTITLTNPGRTRPRLRALTLHSNDVDEPEAHIGLRMGSDSVFVGDPALDFTYRALNTDTEHTLSDQRGKVVLLSYFATF